MAPTTPAASFSIQRWCRTAKFAVAEVLGEVVSPRGGRRTSARPSIGPSSCGPRGARNGRADLPHEDLAQPFDVVLQRLRGAGAGTAPGTHGHATMPSCRTRRRAAAIARSASPTVASAAAPRTSSVAGCDRLVRRAVLGGHQLPVDQQPLFVPDVPRPPSRAGYRHTLEHAGLCLPDRCGDYVLRERVTRSYTQGGATHGERTPEIADFRASCTRGSTRTTTSSRRVLAARDARRPHRADATGEVDALRRGLDAVRMARARRRTRRLADAAHRARRGDGRHATSPTPACISLIEVLAPTLIDFAPPELAAEVVPQLLSGAEMWCQGFSEPGTGSDLASLSCRAVPDGEPGPRRRG